MSVAARQHGSSDGVHCGVIVVESAARADDNYSGLSDNYTTRRMW